MGRSSVSSARRRRCAPPRRRGSGSWARRRRAARTTRQRPNATASCGESGSSGSRPNSPASPSSASAPRRRPSGSSICAASARCATTRPCRATCARRRAAGLPSTGPGSPTRSGSTANTCSPRRSVAVAEDVARWLQAAPRGRALLPRPQSHALLCSGPSSTAKTTASAPTFAVGRDWQQNVQKMSKPPRNRSAGSPARRGRRRAECRVEPSSTTPPSSPSRWCALRRQSLHVRIMPGA